MKKVFKLQDLDCANCARKLEEAIAKLEGVEAVSVNFLSQKMTLTAADDQFDEVFTHVRKTMRKVEPDCQIVM